MQPLFRIAYDTLRKNGKKAVTRVVPFQQVLKCRGQPIDQFCRLITTDSQLLELSAIAKIYIFGFASIAGAAEKVQCHYTVQEHPLQTNH